MPRLAARRSVTPIRLLAFAQVFLLVASLFAPLAVSAQEPGSDPGGSAAPSAEPGAEPSAEPTEAPVPDPNPSPEPPAGPDPTDAPEPTTAPVQTAQPAPDPTSAGAAPTIASDLDDYPPGGLVTLTGSNWQPGESVQIYVNDDSGSSWNRRVDVEADGDGNIRDQFNLPNWFVADYSVVATGEVSGVATWTFTDSNPQAIEVAAPTSVTVVQGSAAAYGTITVQVGGNSNPCTVTLAASSGLPAGATPVFGNSPVTGNSNFTSSLSVTTTAATATGTYTFTILGTNSGSGCQGPGPSPSGSLTLIVASASVATTTTAVNASATFGDSSVTLNATVAPASGPAVNSGTVTFTVNGNSVTSGTVSGGAASATFSLSGVDAGSYTIEAAYSGAAGFNASNNGSQSPAANLVVNKAATTTVLSCPASVTYDGSAHEPCSALATGPAGLSQGLAVEYEDNTDAGTATASAIYAETTNYLGSSNTTTFSIEKAATTTTLDCPASVTYTGSPQTPCSAVVTGVGLNQAVAVTYSNNTNAGTASAGATYLESDNHLGSSDATTFEIEPASSSTVVTFEAGPYVYRGSAFTATAVVTGVGGLNESVSVTYSGDCTNVTATDGCTASATFAGDANHTGSSDSQSITLTKADPVIVVTPYSVTYDGNPHTATGTATGVLGEDLVGLDLSGTTHTDAGTYDDDPWTFTDVTGNYNDDSGTVDDVIEQASSTTVVTCPVSVVYTGSALEPCTVAVTGAGGLNLAPAASYSNNFLVGTATASYVYPGDLNHTGSSHSTTFDILTAFRIVGFDAPVDMTVVGNVRNYNSVKAGQTVPLKFQVFNLDGTEVTSALGLSAMARSVTCATGAIDPSLLPIDSTADNGLRRSGDRFHFNWAVPKGAGTCYQIVVRTVDGSTVMVGNLAGTPVHEAYFRSK